ncbi:uroporphyrinogen-III synthase [Sphingomonas sp. Y38-1Y]|uniref:uroporphyrinogen-III synthase n=1 Tax=Sphingomonas sp. Y38-1Y TaxID=3078265 RepID=UPI0028E6F6F8|nr:uroporphyrinogen-III synthase [Sphingomonas sp. Y38-1Y]
MRRRLIVLRPEPGNAATCAAIEAAGAAAVAMPLFAVVRLAWDTPDPDDFDALVLTSANAVRHAGAGLAAFAHLPAVTVGEATTRAAAAEGLHVVAEGASDAGELPALLARIGATRPLHLAGREHRPLAGAVTRMVYASEPVDPPPVALSCATVLVHSPRAGRRLATLVAPDARASIAVAAISPAALEAAGDDWAAAVAAPSPRDDALIATALSIDPPGGHGDKTP